jgi:hypothetical protein
MCDIKAAYSNQWDPSSFNYHINTGWDVQITKSCVMQYSLDPGILFSNTSPVIHIFSLKVRYHILHPYKQLVYFFHLDL